MMSDDMQRIRSAFSSMPYGYGLDFSYGDDNGMTLDEIASNLELLSKRIMAVSRNEDNVNSKIDRFRAALASVADLI